MNKNTKRVLILYSSRNALYSGIVRAYTFRGAFAQSEWEATFLDIREDIWMTPTAASPAVNSHLRQARDNSQIPFLRQSRLPELPKQASPYFGAAEHIISAAKQAHLIYLVTIDDYSLVAMLRSRTKAKLIYDLSDAVWKRSFIRKNPKWADIGLLLSSADAITSDVRAVNEYAAIYGKPVFIVNSACCYPQKLARLRKQQKEPTRVVIGWMGSASTIHGLFSLAPILDRLAQRHPNLFLRIVGADETTGIPRFQCLPYSCRRSYDEDGMIEECCGFDIGVFPVPTDIRDYEIRGPHKGLKYMGVGIPAVFHRAGDAVQIIKDGVNGMLCADDAEWEAKLEKLICDENLRCEMGKRGYETVEKTHSFEAAFQQLLIAFNAVYQMYVPRLEAVENDCGNLHD